MNLVRLVYMNMIADERIYPWTPKQYEGVVIQSMMYDEFEETRMMNYLALTGQAKSKNPNIKPI